MCQFLSKKKDIKKRLAMFFHPGGDHSLRNYFPLSCRINSGAEVLLLPSLL